MMAAMAFKVYKGFHGTKCVRKFDVLEDAQTWCNIHENMYRIEWVEPANDRYGIGERKNVIYC